MHYAGSTAVVTGAASGIGRALAIELAGRGVNLALSDVNGDGLRDTAERCSASGVTARDYELDVADRKAMLSWADDVAREFGPPQLVVNNAGVAVVADVIDMSWADIDWLMGINFWGVVHGSKAFLPHLIASGNGHLVNISSVFGLIGSPSTSAYNAAKFAVRGFTETLRQEMIVARHPVVVSCVHPGGIDTNIARTARMAVSDEAKKQGTLTLFERVTRTTPERAAQVILGGVDRGKARILIGADAHVIDAAARALGAGYEGLWARAVQAGLRLAGRRRAAIPAATSDS